MEESFRVSLPPLAYRHFGLRFPADMNEVQIVPEFLQFPNEIESMGQVDENGKQAGRLRVPVEITFPNHGNMRIVAPVNTQVSMMRYVNGDRKVILNFNPDGQLVMAGGKRRRSTRRHPHRRRRQNTRRSHHRR